MDTGEYITTLSKIQAGLYPIRIDSDKFVSRKLIAELIEEGYVSAKMQTPNNSTFVNLSLTADGKVKLAKLKRAHPWLTKMLLLKSIKINGFHILFGLLSAYFLNALMKLFFGR